jgi:hypothetical protein
MPTAIPTMVSLRRSNGCALAFSESLIATIMTTAVVMAVKPISSGRLPHDLPPPFISALSAKLGRKPCAF